MTNDSTLEPFLTDIRKMFGEVIDANSKTVAEMKELEREGAKALKELERQISHAATQEQLQTLRAELNDRIDQSGRRTDEILADRLKAVRADIRDQASEDRQKSDAALLERFEGVLRERIPVLVDAVVADRVPVLVAEVSADRRDYVVSKFKRGLSTATNIVMFVTAAMALIYAYNRQPAPEGVDRATDAAAGLSRVIRE